MAIELVVLEPSPESQPASVPLHQHKGADSPRISIKDLGNLIEVVSSVPTHTPRNMFDQIKIYVSGTQNSFFIYETTNKTWKFINLT